MGSSSPDRIVESTGKLSQSPGIKIRRRALLGQIAGVAVAGGLATGLGIPGSARAQEAATPVSGPPVDNGDGLSPGNEDGTANSAEAAAPGDGSAEAKTIEAYPTTFPERFGNLEEDGLLVINKGKKSGLAQGDLELYKNILWARDNYAANPNIEVVIVTYDSIKQMEASGVEYNPARATAWPWDSWGREVALADRTRQKFPPTFTDGQIRWFVSPDGSRMEFHMTMPEALPGITPHWSQYQVLSSLDNNGSLPIFRFLFDTPNGYDGDNEVRYSLDRANKEDADPNYQLYRVAEPVDGYRRYKFPVYIVSK